MKRAQSSRCTSRRWSIFGISFGTCALKRKSRIFTVLNDILVSSGRSGAGLEKAGGATKSVAGVIDITGGTIGGIGVRGRCGRGCGCGCEYGCGSGSWTYRERGVAVSEATVELLR